MRILLNTKARLTARLFKLLSNALASLDFNKDLLDIGNTFNLLYK